MHHSVEYGPDGNVTRFRIDTNAYSVVVETERLSVHSRIGHAWATRIDSYGQIELWPIPPIENTMTPEPSERKK